MTLQILKYWGKARPLNGHGFTWHPLAYHGLDVAAAGAAYLNLRADVLSQIAKQVGLPEDVARNWLLFGFAIHDLGKFSDCFQTKFSGHESPVWQAAGEDPGHGSVGTALWSLGCNLDSAQHDVGFSYLFSDPGHAARFNPWIQAIFGHHGRPVGHPSAHLKQLMTPAAAADARAFVEACAALFPLAAPGASNLGKERDFKETSWLVAGNAMIADWIGSNQNWFPYTKPDDDPETYWRKVQPRAEAAVANAQLSRSAVSPDFSLRDALATPADEDDPKPSDLQKWALDEFRPSGQSLVIIEDLTGSGKTEAALIAAHRLMARNLAGGLYWALPTMATANSLYARLAQSYKLLYAATEISLILAHGKREFNSAYQRSILPAGHTEKSYGSEPDDESSSAQCAAWIADDRRKAFLADVGIGTVDQALLAVLPAKHQAMRLAALSQRILVIDEIHSYDPYVSKLIGSLLEFHAALGGSAILLSATMTQKLRADLISAFAKGAKWPKQVPASDRFPLVTVVNNAPQPTELPREPARGTRRDLAVERLNLEQDAIVRLVAAYNDGKASVWIRNTVHDAINAATALRAELGPNAAVDLFHARFAIGDRIDIETRTLENFGKQSIGDRRKRILVATQVVEQSLDLDFDVMISDLAPIDLLIQRAGRLHRHNHRGDRPAPTLHVLAPDPSGNVTARWIADMFPKGQYVYQDHGQLWLTMKHLLDARGLRLESTSPRVPIEAVFSGAVPDGLLSVSGKALGVAAAQRGIAQMNALRLSDGYAGSTGSWKSDEITPTRLGARQRNLRLAKWDGATLKPWYSDPDGNEMMSWRFSEVQVLAARVAEVTVDAVPAAMVEKIRATWPEKFEPPLLVPLHQIGGVWACEVTGEPLKDGGVGRKARLSYDATLGLRFD